jgi:DNA-binding PadR family transcriptional regulator
MEPVTSYEMKQRVAVSLGYFWSFPHSQLYAEPARLANAGLLDEELELTGRRRRLYRLAPQGRDALQDWLASHTRDQTELRDLGMLKLFFSRHGSVDDRRALADRQWRWHDERRRQYEVRRDEVAQNGDEWELAALEMGLRFETIAVIYWHEVLERCQLGAEPDASAPLS